MFRSLNFTFYIVHMLLFASYFSTGHADVDYFFFCKEWTFVHISFWSIIIFFLAISIQYLHVYTVLHSITLQSNLNLTNSVQFDLDSGQFLVYPNEHLFTTRLYLIYRYILFLIYFLLVITKD